MSPVNLLFLELTSMEVDGAHCLQRLAWSSKLGAMPSTLAPFGGLSHLVSWPLALSLGRSGTPSSRTPAFPKARRGHRMIEGSRVARAVREWMASDWRVTGRRVVAHSTSSGRPIC